MKLKVPKSTHTEDFTIAKHSPKSTHVKALTGCAHNPRRLLTLKVKGNNTTSDTGQESRKAEKVDPEKTIPSRVIKIIQSKYSKVLKVTTSNAKLTNLGADVRSIRRTRTGEMII